MNSSLKTKVICLDICENNVPSLTSAQGFSKSSVLGGDLFSLRPLDAVWRPKQLSGILWSTLDTKSLKFQLSRSHKVQTFWVTLRSVATPPLCGWPHAKRKHVLYESSSPGPAPQRGAKQVLDSSLPMLSTTLRASLFRPLRARNMGDSFRYDMPRPLTVDMRERRSRVSEANRVLMIELHMCPR